MSRLFEFVSHLRSIEETEQIVSATLPGLEMGEIDIYLEGVLDINSEVRLFDADAIPNTLTIEIDGIQYVNLFPLLMAQEMAEAYANLPGERLNDMEIAQKLIQYRIKDA